MRAVLCASLVGAVGCAGIEQRREDERLHRLALELNAQLEEAKEEAKKEKTQREEAERQHQQWQTEITQTAKRHGYRGVILDVGLADVLNKIIAGDLPLDFVKPMAIQIRDWEDKHLSIVQVLEPGIALISGDATNAMILFHCDCTLIEQSRLTSIGVEFVEIKGLMSYPTLLGSRQAFIVEPAW